MNRAIEAELPAGVEPVWPDACVACGCASPEGFLRFWTVPSTLWAFVLPPLSVHASRPPVCAACRPRIRRRRRGSLAGNAVVCLAAVLVTRHFFGGGFGGPLHLQTMLLVPVLMVAPYFLAREVFRWRRPAAFRFTVKRDATVYGFRHAGFAEAFFVANPAATLVEADRYASRECPGRPDRS